MQGLIQARAEDLQGGKSLHHHPDPTSDHCCCENINIQLLRLAQPHVFPTPHTPEPRAAVPAHPHTYGWRATAGKRPFAEPPQQRVAPPGSGALLGRPEMRAAVSVPLRHGDPKYVAQHNHPAGCSESCTDIWTAPSQRRRPTAQSLTSAASALPLLPSSAFPSSRQPPGCSSPAACLRRAAWPASVKEEVHASHPES